MARFQAVQTNFRVGQISPRLQGYVDLPDYQNALKTLENFVVLPQSSVTRRPGTQYVNTTHNNVQSRLIPFNFGQAESYALEFSAGRIRIFYVDPSDGEPKLIPNTTAIADNSITQYTDLDGSSQNLPWATGELSQINWTQSADTMFLVHPSYPPLRLKRTGADLSDWSVDEFPFKNGPFLPVNTENVWLRPGSVDAADYNDLKVGEIPNGSNDYIDTSSDTLVLVNHGLTDGEIIYLDNDIPGGLTANIDYFVIQATTNTFKVSTSKGGEPVAINSNGSTGNSTHVHKKFIGEGASITLTAYTGTLVERCTLNQNTDTFTTEEAHGLVNGDQMRLKSGNVDELSLDTTYYVVSANAAAKTFKLSLTPGGSAVTFSGTRTDVSVGGLYKFEEGATHINDGDGFQDPEDEGRLIRLNTAIYPSIKWGYGRITSVDSTTQITVKVLADLGPNEETKEFALGAFSVNTGFPRTVTIYQQRMVFAGNDEEPQAVHFSKTGDFDNFATSEPLGQVTGTGVGGANIFGEQIYDDNALTLKISSDTVDRIVHLAPADRLTVGTTGGIFQMFGSRDDVTLTPYNFSVVRIAAWAAADARPVEIGNNLLYIQQANRKIRALDYSRTEDEYAADDLTIRAENISNTGIVEIVYQDQPSALVWGRRQDGKLACLTYVKDVPVIAWHLHVIGGSHTDATYGNHAKVESLCVIPQADHDQLWMIVKRDIDGSETRYVEVMQRFYDSAEIDVQDAWYVDSGAKRSATGSATSTMNGLDHLEGESVSIYADAAPQPNRDVASGSISLELAADDIIAGLGYNSNFQTLPLIVGTRENSSVGQRKRVHRIIVQFLESMGLKYGVDADNLFEEDFRLTSDLLDQAVPLFSGQKELALPAAFTRTGEVYLRQDQALPMTITLLALDYETND